MQDEKQALLERIAEALERIAEALEGGGGVHTDSGGTGHPGDEDGGP